MSHYFTKNFSSTITLCPSTLGRFDHGSDLLWDILSSLLENRSHIPNIKDLTLCSDTL